MIDTSWAKALDIVPANFNTSWDHPHQRGGIPEMVGQDETWYSGKIDSGNYTSNGTIPIHFSLGGGISEAWALSTLVNLYLTTGLAYLRMEANRYVKVEDLKQPGKSYLINLPAFNDAKYAVGLVNDLLEWLRTVSPQHGSWLNVSWEVFRYGYGWSFRDTTIRLAATVPLLYSLLAISHMGFLLHRGWMPCGDWSSLSEILLLALESSSVVRSLSKASIPRSQKLPWKHRILPRYDSRPSE